MSRRAAVHTLIKQRVVDLFVRLCNTMTNSLCLHIMATCAVAHMTTRSVTITLAFSKQLHQAGSQIK